MTYQIRITEASGDVVSTQDVDASDRSAGERRQAEHWNENYGHTADRYMSELLEDGQVVSTIGGWDEDDDEGEDEDA